MVYEMCFKRFPDTGWVKAAVPPLLSDALRRKPLICPVMVGDLVNPCL